MKKVLGLLVLGFLLNACANRPAGSDNQEEGKAKIVDDGFSKKDSRRSTTSAKSFETENENLTLANYLRQVPGVNVNGSGYNARVTIRGVKQIYGASEALFVVDGVPMSGGLGEVSNMVEVRNIDRVTVLKDGSSTAIYGARGGSGVIVIKTKKE